MSDFDLDILVELLMHLVEDRSLLWDKNDGIYEERKETRNVWKKVCAGPKEDFEIPGDVYDDGTKTTLQ